MRHAFLGAGGIGGLRPSARDPCPRDDEAGRARRGPGRGEVVSSSAHLAIGVVERAEVGNGKAPFPGLFGSRPVSRILSWVTISLGRPLPVGSSGVPGSSAGSVIGTCFTLHRTGFGEPPCHHGAGGLLPHPFTLTAGVSGEFVAGSGLLSVPLSVGFRRLGFPQRPALRCPDFPRTDSSFRPAVTRPAHTILAGARPRKPGPGAGRPS